MPAAVVLGGGMVGSVIARDLVDDPEHGFDVTLADRSEAALQRAAARCGGAVDTVTADLSDPQAIARVIESADIVLGALASSIAFDALRAVIEAGKPFCDISFMPENALELDALARDRGVTAVVDCGVAPGMSNMFAGRAARDLDPCRSIDIFVGGIPRERRLPFQYKAGFSPHDVIEEYTRPARLVEGGRVVTREALTEPEYLDFPGIGTLEAFNTDGLRSLIDTLDVPEMREKTLRYPGHRAMMHAFRETGLFDREPIEVDGRPVRPMDVTAALLFPKWTYEEGEPDLTVMRVIAEGDRDGRAVCMKWDLHDEFDAERGITSMARTTAYPAAIVARMILAGRIDEPGVLAPERLGQVDGLLEDVLEQLAARGVRFTSTVEDAHDAP